MLNNFVIENIKRELGFEKIQFVKIDWIFSNTGTGNLTHSERVNNIDGILLFNISLTQVGTGSTLKIIDNKRTGHIIFEGLDAIPGLFVISPFIYFVPDNTLNFSIGVPPVSFGFNYVTIRRDQ